MFSQSSIFQTNTDICSNSISLCLKRIRFNAVFVFPRQKLSVGIYVEAILQKYLLCNLYFFCCWMLCKFPNSEQPEQGKKCFKAKCTTHTFICMNRGTNACMRACMRVCVCEEVMLRLGENLTMNILHRASVCARWVWGQWLPSFQLKIFFCSFFPILKCVGERGIIKIMKGLIQTLFLGK